MSLQFPCINHIGQWSFGPPWSIGVYTLLADKVAKYGELQYTLKHNFCYVDLWNLFFELLVFVALSCIDNVMSIWSDSCDTAALGWVKITNPDNLANTEAKSRLWRARYEWHMILVVEIYHAWWYCCKMTLALGWKFWLLPCHHNQLLLLAVSRSKWWSSPS